MADEHGSRSAGQRGLLLCTNWEQGLQAAGQQIACSWTPDYMWLATRLHAAASMQPIACSWTPYC